jgi:hypothetical protein
LQVRPLQGPPLLKPFNSIATLHYRNLSAFSWPIGCRLSRARASAIGPHAAGSGCHFQICAAPVWSGSRFRGTGPIWDSPPWGALAAEDSCQSPPLDSVHTGSRSRCSEPAPDRSGVTIPRPPSPGAQQVLQGRHAPGGRNGVVLSPGKCSVGAGSGPGVWCRLCALGPAGLGVRPAHHHQIRPTDRPLLHGVGYASRYAPGRQKDGPAATETPAPRRPFGGVAFCGGCQCRQREC